MDDECPICYEKLDETAIKLNCGHKFHYNCILNSYKMATIKNNIKLFRKCPYCRNIQNSILPRREGYPLIYGINSPMKYIMYTNKCSHIFKKGVKKGQICNSGCEGLYCIKHQKINVIENTCKYVFKRGVKKGELCNNICSSIYFIHFCVLNGVFIIIFYPKNIFKWVIYFIFKFIG